jgi:hypothetical protein
MKWKIKIFFVRGRLFEPCGIISDDFGRLFSLKKRGRYVSILHLFSSHFIVFCTCSSYLNLMNAKFYSNRNRLQHNYRISKQNKSILRRLPLGISLLGKKHFKIISLKWLMLCTIFHFTKQRQYSSVYFRIRYLICKVYRRKKIWSIWILFFNSSFNWQRISLGISLWI